METHAPNAERVIRFHERSHSSLGPLRQADPLTIVESYLKGEHPLLKSVRNQIVSHARSSSPVVFVGETGTGKQVGARALHAAGPRRDRRLVLAAVGSLPPSLAQSELFGHIRGAFTGADRERKGLFLEARGSTLVLDDITDFPADLQAMLLNAVEYGIIRRVGSDVDEMTNTRVVATANCPLLPAVEAGRFREDLYYRLSGGEIRIPPLREHLSDLPMYAKSYLLEEAIRDGAPPRTLSDGALNVLCEHDWPGNVRELHNVLSRALHATESEILQPEHVAAQIRNRGTKVLEAATPSPQREPTAEEAHIRKALEEARWNVTRAAKALGFGRTKLYERMAAYHIAR
jgi:serine/threonine-protein kinase PknK